MNPYYGDPRYTGANLEYRGVKNLNNGFVNQERGDIQMNRGAN